MSITGNPVVPMAPYEERLASLPMAPVRHPTGDGTQPGTQVEKPPEESKQPTLQTAPVPLKFKAVDALVRSQERMTRNDWAIDTYHRWVRRGVSFGTLEKIPNQSIWVAKLPNGMQSELAAAVPNKADDLCNKLVDTLMADPPKPAPKARSEDQEAKQATDLATRWLDMDGGEAGTNDIESARWALDTAFTNAAAYIHYVIDQTGGGYQPMQKLAHPKATDANNPLQAEVQTPYGIIIENATDPIRRYVNGGEFVDEAAQAERVWLPKIVAERLRRESIRCFPQTATVDNAQAIIVIRHCSLSDAITAWPETVGKMSADQLLALAQWKAPQSEYIVPFAFKGSGDGFGGPTLNEVGSFSPLLQRRMWSYRLYIASCPEYEGGYQLDISGANDGTVLDETDLEYTVTLPIGGKTRRCTDIPITCVRPEQDVEGGNPKGWPVLARFAGGSEVEATLYAAVMDFCDNMLHPHVFIRSTATVDDDDWNDRTVPIILSPSDPEPTYERFSPMPPVMDVLGALDQKMDVISGLTASAQGLDSSNSVSGVAKNAVVRQAQIYVSSFQQNLHAAVSRGWRVKCQLAQKYYTVPQMMEAIGEEGSGEVEWWTGEDFAGVDRVGIQPGTGTMMTPESKAQYVAFLQQQQWLAPDQAAEVALPGIKLDLGLPEDPFEAGIQRDIDAWLKGPPEGWMEAYQGYTQSAQAFEADQIAQQQGQQQAVVQQQQDTAMQPEREKAQATAALEQSKQQHAVQLEREKGALALRQKQQESDTAFREKQLESQTQVQLAHAQRPQTPAVDLAPIQQAIQALAQRIQPPQDIAPLAREVQALGQKVAELVRAKEAIPFAPAPEKKKARKAKITDPSGKEYNVDFGGDE